MRKPILTLLSLILCAICFAQETERTRIYEVRSNIPAWPSGIMGERLPSVCQPYDYCIPWYKSTFAVVRAIDSGMVVVRFLDWYKYRPITRTAATARITSDTALLKVADTTVKTDTSYTRQRYFIIRRQDLDSNCIPVFERGRKNIVFSIGLVTMPMKLRLGNDFDFQGNFSLGTTAGAKMRISKYNPHYVDFLFSAAISTVSLDSFNTQGRVPGQPLSNIATFSPSFGMVFEFGRAQAGIFYGWDILSKSMQSRYGWIHNKKPWISVGFGFSIFNVETQNKAPTADITDTKKD